MLGMLALLLAVAPCAEAARIGALRESHIAEQAWRFFTFRDPAVRVALAGSLMLGVCCGLLGAFLVVRQFAMAGDTLAHAVLPGIALGYLWNLTKNPLHLFVGAMIAGMLGAGTVSAITQTTRLKRDTALGIVLGGFYAMGILLLTMIQRLPGDKSGLRSYLFGSAAALSEADLVLIAVIAAISVGVVTLFFNQFKVASFDAEFAAVIGVPPRVFHYLLMLLLAWAVVSALQAVGVVLVSALLIVPAATAMLLTRRLSRVLFLSAVLGMLAAAAGTFFSFLGPSLPTGPFIILCASAVFAGAFLAAPEQGLLPRWLNRRRQTRRIGRENTLKAMYHLLETSGHGEWVAVDALAAQRERSGPETDREIDALTREGLALLDEELRRVRLTETGRVRAAEIVRNHRLWELYLTNAAGIAADHVHEDAEKIEHVLGEDIVRQLEACLDRPQTDPHGSRIPLVGGKAD